MGFWIKDGSFVICLHLIVFPYLSRTSQDHGDVIRLKILFANFLRESLANVVFCQISFGMKHNLL